MVAIDDWKPREIDKQIQCGLCDETVADVDTAVEAGWIPSYCDYEGEELCVPACPNCVMTRLTYDETTCTYDVIEKSN